MIRILHRAADGKIGMANCEQLPQLLTLKENVIWVDLFDPESSPYSPHAAEPEIERLLRDVFAFHPLALDDALLESHVPKVDDWGNYLYVVLHDVDFELDKEALDTHEIDIFIGRNYLVTYRTESSKAVERVWQNAVKDDRHTRRGVDRLLYELSDAIASDYMPCVDALDEKLDALQNEIVIGAHAYSPTERIFRIKRSVLHLRRILNPQREVMNKLARDDHPVISNRERVYFRDVYDHFLRLADLTESLRDITVGALDTYLSITANRTNEVMKTMTLFTVLFMPLSFLTGFFGMNFFGATYEIPALLSPALLFVLMLTVMIGLPMIILMLVRRRGWW